MSDTIKEIVCLLPNSSLADQTGRLWNMRNNGGIQFFETGGVFDQPYIKFTDGTIFKNYLYTRTVQEDNADFNLGNNFTIEFWVRNITTPTKLWGYIMAYHPDHTTGSGWAISYKSDSKVFQFHDSSSSIVAFTTTKITSMTNWTHIAFVKSNKKMAVYVNGIREQVVDNVPNTYLIDTNIKDGFYIGRHNSSWNSNDTSYVGDFGGLKISKYARYDINLSNIDILDFNLDYPSETFNSVSKRQDILNLYNESQGNIPWLSYKGMVWLNYRDKQKIYNMNNPNFLNYNLYQFFDDKSIIKSSVNSPCGYVMLNQFGRLINNIDQDFTIFWDFYFDERWCGTATPKSQKINFAWEHNQTTQIILYYGRGTEFSFYTTHDGGNTTTEPAESVRKYLDYKFKPHVKYTFAISQKNHKRSYYINGKKIHSRNNSGSFLVYGNDLYASYNNTEISTTAYSTEIEICEKIDNLFVKVGLGIDSDFYDYTDNEYNYDFNKVNDEILYGNIDDIEITENFDIDYTIDTSKVPVVLKTNILLDNIDTSSNAYIIDTSDTRKFKEADIFIEGKNNKIINYISAVDSMFNKYKPLKVVEPITNTILYDDKNVSFINHNKPELISYDINKRIKLGYITGELEQNNCKSDKFFIKVFNHNTNRFIGEYEIKDGFFTAHNLNYFELYDVVLCDRLSKVENQVMSKRKPTIYNYSDLEINYNAFSIFDTALTIDNIRTYINIKYTSLDFKNNTLPNGFTLTRNSVGTYFNNLGVLADASVNEPRFEYHEVDGKYVCKGLLVEVASTNLVDNYIQAMNLWSPNGSIEVTPSNGKILLNFPSYSINYVELLPKTTKVYGAGVATQSLRFSKMANNNMTGNFSFYDTQHNSVNGYNYSNTIYSENYNLVAGRSYRQIDFTSIKYNSDTAIELYGIQMEKLPYATSLIKTINNTNNTRSADILSLNYENISNSVLYIYYNQSEPTRKIYEFMDYINSQPNALPNGFVSGWIDEIRIYEALLSDDEKSIIIENLNYQ